MATPSVRQGLEEIRRSGVRRSAGRVWRGLRRHGLRGFVNRAGEALGRDYRWYRLEVADRSDRPLDGTLRLTEPGPAGVKAYEALSPMNARIAGTLFEAGGRLFLVQDGEAAAFACWIFPGRTPVGEAPGGWLDVPEGAVCLEHSITSADYRGRGVAPGAWSAIAERLTAEGTRTMVTKVAEDNAPTRAALAKVGFVDLEPEHPVARSFAAQLGSRRR